MKKALTPILAILAVAAIVVCFVINGQKNDASSKLSDITAKLTDAEGLKDAAEAAKAEAEAKLTELEGKVTEAEAKVTEAEAKAADLATKLTDMEGLKDAAEAAKAEAEAKVTELEGKVSEAEAKLTELQNKATEAVEAVTEAAAPEAKAEEAPAAEAAPEAEAAPAAEAAPEAKAGEAPAAEAAPEAKAEEAPAAEAAPEAADNGVMTYEQFAKAALEEPVCVETYVQANQAWWDGKIKLYTQSEDGAYFIYDMACTEEEAAKLTVPGTRIRVKGFKAEWSGEVEIIDATYEILEADPFIAEPEDVTALLGKDELAGYMNKKVAFKGLKVAASKVEGKDEEFPFLYAWDGSGSSEANSDLYFNVELDGNVYNFCVESYLCASGTDVYKAVEALKVGDTIDCEGFLYWYNGANPHITNVTVK